VVVDIRVDTKLTAEGWAVTVQGVTVNTFTEEVDAVLLEAKLVEAFIDSVRTLGHCEYSAIHQETPHFFEPGTCKDWRAL